MHSELIINAAPWETRVALLENGSVVEFHVERADEQRYVGNIFKGRVVRVLPGMQASFVDIGLDRTAILYVTGVHDHLSEFKMMLDKNDWEENTADNYRTDKEHDLHFTLPPFRIEDLIHEGQEILVQVTRSASGNKGARVTSHISLPGRNLVIMPTINHMGVSRRIRDEPERRRLKKIMESLRPEGVGFIARTASEGATPGNIKAEMEFLLKLWKNIQDKAVNIHVPSLVHEDLDITLRAVRDLFSCDVEQLVVDSKPVYKRIQAFVETFAPQLRPSVEFYDQSMPIFDAFGIEVEMSRAIRKKVWLKSGGYIIIENTEALTAIDVNTGKFVGKYDLEDTILKTNLEAAKEIAYQLRLRNIGGLIIIDFIDMENATNREDVFNTLKGVLKKDRCKTNILRISELGLIQMTRKRNRENLKHLYCEPCFYCDGAGELKSRRSLCCEIFRRIQRDTKHTDSNDIQVLVHPGIGEMLLKEQARNVELLEKSLEKKITIVSKPELHLEQFQISYL